MKKYIVRLTDEERTIREDTIGRLKGSSQKAKRARILIQVDADGPGWTDERVAATVRCTVQTVENVRKRCVQEGFEIALKGRRRTAPAVPGNVPDGKQEAELIALRPSPPPPGYATWSLRLLARRVVELGIVDSISHETVRRTLRKTASRDARCSAG